MKKIIALVIGVSQLTGVAYSGSVAAKPAPAEKGESKSKAQIASGVIAILASLGIGGSGIAELVHQEKITGLENIITQKIADREARIEALAESGITEESPDYLDDYDLNVLDADIAALSDEARSKKEQDFVPGAKYLAPAFFYIGTRLLSKKINGRLVGAFGLSMLVTQIIYRNFVSEGKELSKLHQELLQAGADLRNSDLSSAEILAQNRQFADLAKRYSQLAYDEKQPVSVMNELSLHALFYAALTSMLSR